LVITAKVKLIKTLPHLVPLHLANLGEAFYASFYTPQIEKYLTSLSTFQAEDLRFSQFKKSLVADYNFELTTHIDNLLQASITGDVINLWPVGYPHPVRLEFFGEDLEKMYLYDENYGRKLHTIHQVVIGTKPPAEKQDQQLLTFNSNWSEAKSAPERAIFSNYIPELLIEPDKLEIQNNDFSYPQLFWNRIDLLQKEIGRFEELNYAIIIQTKHLENLPSELHIYVHKQRHKLLPEVLPDLLAGLISTQQKLVIFTDREIFGTIFLTKHKSGDTKTMRLLKQFEGEISVGDYVVHEDHGIGMYAGLTQEEIDGQLQEYLLLQYAGSDQVYVPISQVEKLTKYIGNEGLEPRLSRLGKAEWQNVRTKVAKSVTILARELIEHYARREVAKAKMVNKEDSPEFTKFVESFPFTETEDQLHSTNEIIADLQKAIPMNRLLIGDVGFGKTEVMMRAAFKVVEAGMQVVILCPTTILAAQHLAVFTERFKGTKIKIASLSRFNTSKENRELTDLLNTGNVDIAIGTHRLLSNDVKFKNLGLLIVDEEQRFGVRQKEKIKTLNYGVHHLSVSATPIPRTLSMALSTVQDISIITQPPVGRKAIHTELWKNDWHKVAQAIHTEITRGGQIYFVHNAVETIASIKDRLQKLLPAVRIIIGHGQMPSSTLDKVISDFYTHKYDILLCTTIIENGLDMPNVNTMIVNQAQRFGLSQLYQLRGRVGRSSKQAFCYLVYDSKPEKEDSDKQPERVYMQRLQALADASELGAGFQIASRDLEIRGAGNILGEQQSGHISSVGYALYMQLLAQEMERLKAVSETHFKPTSLTGFVR
jgi:transcription-repair coupling factor (superfamily II helicase)